MGTVLNQVAIAVVRYCFPLNLVMLLDQLPCKIEPDIKGGNVKLCWHGFQRCLLSLLKEFLLTEYSLAIEVFVSCIIGNSYLRPVVAKL